MLLARRRRHLERYIEIGRILARHGWQNLLSRIGLAGIFHVRGHQREAAVPGPVQVRETLEELGPTFIKLGQILSTRPDIIPAPYATELEKLQDAAPNVPIEKILRVIREEFRCPVEEVFADFDEEQLAAASLGQTHLATLSDGRRVVVKVQRPDIRHVIETDLEIISDVAHFLEQHFEGMRAYTLSDLVDEFSIVIRQELDYTREGRNGDELKREFEDIDYVHIAATIWDYSTPRVLTAECLSGSKITDFGEIDARGLDKKQIARNIWRAYLKMLFVDGFFHGDPHPGNLKVMDGNVIGFLDYGMMGRLDRELKMYVTMLLSEYVQQDSAGFTEVLLAIGTVPPDLDHRAYEQDMDRILRQYYGAPLRDIRMGEVLQNALRTSAKYRVRFPASLGLVVKVIIGVEGIDRLLDPDYDMASEARPFISESIRREFSLKCLREQGVRSLLEWKRLFFELPHRTSEVLDRMAGGTFRIVFKHEGLESPVKDLDRSANRLSFALIASATIIASAQIVSANVGPVWRGFPIVGLIGFAIAFVFAIWLIISIIRAGNLW